MNIFKSTLLFLISAFVCYSCGTPSRIFYLTLYSENMMESVSVSGSMHQSTTGHMNYYEMTKDNSIYPIFIPKEKLENAGVENIEVFTKLCYERNFKQALSFTDYINADNNDYTSYLKAIVYTLDYKFEKSNEYLNQITTHELLLEKELLFLDNQYQVKKNYPNFNKNYFIEAYQEIIDSYKLEEGTQKMISQRIKKFRYL